MITSQGKWRQQSGADKFLLFIVYMMMALAVVVTLYPFIYVTSMSLSSLEAVASQKVKLLPVGFSLLSYKLVFSNPDVLRSFYNTLWYTVVGSSLSVAATILGAYPLSRKELIWRKPFMLIIIVTMYFGGGLIPNFLLVKNLGLLDTRWAIVLPPLVSAFNLIVCKTFFQQTNESVIESAKIDGCNDFVIFLRIIIPISMPIIAVMALFYAVGHWNSYFSALIFLRDSKLYPLQIYLLNTIVQNNDSSALAPVENTVDRAMISMQIKYALIMVTTLPILFIYPFAQKYFVKGVMLGSVKE